MRRVRAFLALLSLLVLPGCFGLFWGTTTSLSGTVRLVVPPVSGDASIGPESVLVSFLGPSGRAASAPTATAYLPPTPPPVELLLYSERLSPSEAEDLAGRTGFEYLRSSPRGYHVLRDRLGRSESQAIRDLQGAYRGARIEPNRPVYPLAVNDPLYEQQWALALIGAEAAWEAARWDADPVVVAIIDTGIDFDHADLRDVQWTTGRDFADPKVAGGIEYGPGINDAGKAEDHGTMVAGIIAAVTNNGVEVAGTVGPGANVKLMPVRVFRIRLPTEGPTIGEATIAEAIEWAVDHGADVINLSLGDVSCSSVENKCQQPGPVLREALEYAHDRGVVVVAAAGNNFGAVVFPANYRTTIAVGAVAPDVSSKNDSYGVRYSKAGYSASGDELDLMAPGGAGGSRDGDCKLNPVGLKAGGSVTCAEAGTSFATPHVSGVIAMMIAKYRSLGFDYGPDDLRLILQITATDMGEEGWDRQTGYGLINAHAAVTAGVPVIFAGSRQADGLEAAHVPVRSQLGGVFRLTGVPEGVWTLYGWVDADGSGTLNPGDFFQEYGQVRVAKGRPLSGIRLELSRYDGEELAVRW